MANGGPRHRSRAHRGLAPDQEAVLDLQRLAGNEAVAEALRGGRSGDMVTTVDAVELKRDGMDPDLGIQKIREQTENKMTLALTQRSILDAPPLFRAETPEQTKGGYTTKARKVGSIPEPMIHEWWPKAGLHKLPDGSLLDITATWEKKLEEGEDEHRDDATLAWRLTWKKVQDTINQFAEKPAAPEATPEAATKSLWKRYVAALDPELQPGGDQPSDARQKDVLAVRPGTFFAHTWETTVARDTRMNHETRMGAAPKDGHPAPKGTMVSGVEPHPEFKVRGPTSADLIADVRKKWKPGRVITGSKMK